MKNIKIKTYEVRIGLNSTGPGLGGAVDTPVNTIIMKFQIPCNTGRIP
jgi:hypothetical protein